MQKIKLTVSVNEEWAMKGYDESRYSGSETLTREVHSVATPRKGETIFLQSHYGIALIVSEVCHMIDLVGNDSYLDVNVTGATPEEMQALLPFGFKEE